MWHRSTETFSHEILWRASQTALRTATIDHAHIRPDHLAIQSLLCGFLAFEGFINFVGEEIAPSVWANEREFFGPEDFRGIAGKVKYLFTLFPGAQLKKGEEPYQTFWKLKRTRDDLAHNRVLRVTEVTANDNPEFSTQWESFDSPAKVEKGLTRLKELAEIIRLEALKRLNEDYQVSHLNFRAFEGPIASSSGTDK
jgi:hypothetical protein